MTFISSRIYDEPPTDEDYPYIVIGEATENSANRLNRIGYEDTLTTYIYTKPAGLGFYQAKYILGLMNNSLNIKKLPMDTYTMVICKLDNSMTEKDGDKRIIHARYRVTAHSDTNITL
jgi:hypothetical protein